ncbi:cob(I)yrinic acid a,c-diamide adenosyltransferase [Alkalicella caledoniensis]|uniref:Cob(I)yrinic acid a,c-diamide adenosyltransferase n=1 Tax=Alkalicella caledoniensis TaxID=2731377 RepID=A0A7G9W599_ALKCA|nr:cob(I)yrinic acid a,c-diamide adenosyltransferase [Alkalicella caledoniensis]QNO13861.1 cob(I)yrinic acid a,c-diamide adenosyltransferase [Alkalicella caledoniensis]
MEKGYVQIYTGDGKGKTTAALGLGFRAVGRGFKVTLLQFLKGMYTGEIESIDHFKDKFTLKRIGETNSFFWTLTQQEQVELSNQCQKEWKEFLSWLEKNPQDVLILDEIMAAMKNGLISQQQVCQFIDEKPEGMEIILTGRDVPPEVSEKADLITEMKKIKHYYDQGVTSRDGIER